MGGPCSGDHTVSLWGQTQAHGHYAGVISVERHTRVRELGCGCVIQVGGWVPNVWAAQKQRHVPRPSTMSKHYPRHLTMNLSLPHHRGWDGSTCDLETLATKSG